MTYGHLMTKGLPYKPLYFQPGSLLQAQNTAIISVIIFQMELKFVNTSYFKQLFQKLRPKLQYSKNRIFVTSHFATLYRSSIYVLSMFIHFHNCQCSFIIPNVRPWLILWRLIFGRTFGFVCRWSALGVGQYSQFYEI